MVGGRSTVARVRRVSSRRDEGKRLETYGALCDLAITPICPQTGSAKRRAHVSLVSRKPGLVGPSVTYETLFGSIWYPELWADAIDSRALEAMAVAAKDFMVWIFLCFN